MKFSLISDMHVDFPQKKTPYDKFEKNIIVAGDTSNGLVGLKFLNKLRHKGHEVFAVDGNHEHYRNVSQDRTLIETEERFREENPNVSSFEGIPVIGCNGWYFVGDPRLWYSYMNDGSNIVGSHSETAMGMINTRAHMDYMFLKERLEALDNKCIVVTHTAPCTETLNPEFEGSFSNDWYYNPLMYRLLEQFSDKIHVWCHGHTHAKNEALVHDVRVVCNPRGYPGENPDWEPLTIEI